MLLAKSCDRLQNQHENAFQKCNFDFRIIFETLSNIGWTSRKLGQKYISQIVLSWKMRQTSNIFRHNTFYKF